MSIVEIYLPFKIVTKSNIVYKNTVSFGEDNFFDAILNASFAAASNSFTASNFSFPLKNNTSLDPTDITACINYFKNQDNYDAWTVRNPIQVVGTDINALDTSSYNGHFNQRWISNTSNTSNNADVYRNGNNIGNADEADWAPVSGKSFEVVRNNAILKTIIGQFSKDAASKPTHTFNDNLTTNAVSNYFLTSELNVTASSIGAKLNEVVSSKQVQEFLLTQILAKLSETQINAVVKSWNEKPRATATTNLSIDFLELLKANSITVKLSLHIKDLLSLDGLIDADTFRETPVSTVGTAGTQPVSFVNNVILPGSSFAADESTFEDYVDIKVVYTLY